MKKWYAIAPAFAAVATAGILFGFRYVEDQRKEQLHYDQGETELIVSNLSHARLRLFRAGAYLDKAKEIHGFDGMHIWLERGNYFLMAAASGHTFYYPIPLSGYRSGPDEDGSFAVTVRHYPTELPSGDFVYIPSGHFLLGDRLNPQEPHYVWLTSYFVSPFEVTNQQFREFVRDGYQDESNWTKEAKRWKRKNPSRSSAMLTVMEPEYGRFGQPDQPATDVKWFEANAYCRWLTRKLGQGKWMFALPSEAEWEKAARGPDSFDYGLSRSLSDKEVPFYNWKKNPDAAVTVIGIRDSPVQFRRNRYGLYHMSGNVAEWTQSVVRPYNRERPYEDDDRNHDDTAGLRVVRGGSWYNASVALLTLAYRDTFQPEHSTPERGFRIVARRLP